MGRNLSGHGKKATERGLTHWRPQKKSDTPGHGMKATSRWARGGDRGRKVLSVLQIRPRPEVLVFVNRRKQVCGPYERATDNTKH